LTSKSQPNAGDERRINMPALEAGSREVKDRAAALNERIEAFEGWICSLEGRVQTGVSVSAAEPSRWDGLHLRLTGSGDAWQLKFCWFNEPLNADDIQRMRRLVEGSIEAKITAIQAFPSLVDELEKSQRELIDRLRLANASYDAFATRMGILRQGGV
jgi:hypothetical protein